MSSSSVSSPPGYAPLTTGIIVVCTTFPILSTLSIIARFWIRNAYNIPIQADDWILIPALVSQKISHVPRLVVERFSALHNRDLWLWCLGYVNFSSVLRKGKTSY